MMMQPSPPRCNKKRNRDALIAETGMKFDLTSSQRPKKAHLDDLKEQFSPILLPTAPSVTNPRPKLLPIIVPTFRQLTEEATPALNLEEKALVAESSPFRKESDFGEAIKCTDIRTKKEEEVVVGLEEKSLDSSLNEASCSERMNDIQEKDHAKQDCDSIDNTATLEVHQAGSESQETHDLDNASSFIATCTLVFLDPFHIYHFRRGCVGH